MEVLLGKALKITPFERIIRSRMGKSLKHFVVGHAEGVLFGVLNGKEHCTK